MKGKFKSPRCIPSLKLRDLIFPRSTISYCDVIATYSDQQAVDIYVVINEKLEHVNVETLKNKSSLNRIISCEIFIKMYITVIWPSFICHNLSYFRYFESRFSIEKYVNSRFADHNDVTTRGRQRGKIKSHTLRRGTIHLFSQWSELFLHSKRYVIFYHIIS